MFRKLLLLHKKTLLLATLLSVLSALAGIAVISQVNTEIGRLGGGSTTWAGGVTVFLALLAGFLCTGVLSQYMLTRLSVRVLVSIREQMIQRILATTYQQIEHIGGHRVLATLTKDIEALTATLTSLPHIAYNFATVVFCLAYLGYQSWQLFLWVLLVLSVAVVVIQLMMAVGIRRFQQVRELDDELFRNFRALIDGGKELSINFNRKRFFYQAVVQPNIDEIRQRTVSAHLVFILLNNWASLMLFLALGSVVFAAQRFLPQLSTEILVSFVLTLIYLVGPLSVLLNSYSVIAEGVVAAEKIEKLALAQHQISLAQPVYPTADWQQLQISQVCYTYPHGDDYSFSVGPVDLTIQRGEVIYLIGGNGCGKSTFAKLLCGLYSPASGSLSIDGRSASQDLDWYRSHFSTIFSDFYVFPQVLNARGERAADDDIRRYLQQLQLADKVQVKDGVLSTTELSHGQRKRLALLLSYMEDAPIYLFDEWAADQDPYFRNFFYTELLAQLKAQGKTVFVISHDDAYFGCADRIIRFDQGQAAEICVRQIEQIRPVMNIAAARQIEPA